MPALSVLLEHIPAGAVYIIANSHIVEDEAVGQLIPVLVAYAFFNRFFVSGLTAGAVKG